MYLGFWRPVALKPAPLLGVGRKCALELSNSGLRERIWAHYELALFEHYRQDRLTQAELPFDDPSF